jgi:hypothetical protein
MKKMLNTLGVGVFTSIVFFSCSKSPNDGTGGSTPTTVARIRDFQFSPSVVLYNQSVKASWKSDAVTATLNGTLVLPEDSKTLSGLTNDTFLKLIVTSGSSTDQQEKIVPVADQFTSWVVSNKWKLDHQEGQVSILNGGLPFPYPMGWWQADDVFTFSITATNNGNSSGSAVLDRGTLLADTTDGAPQTSPLRLSSTDSTFTMFYENYYSVTMIDARTLQMKIPSTFIVLGGGGVYVGILTKTFKNI